MQYNRILLKLSGESLMGEQKYGIDTRCLESYARQIHEIAEMGIQIGIVIGGGNIFRGLSGTNKGFDRVKGDSMGMLATVINSLALSSALDNEGCKNKVLTAIRMEPIGEFYSKAKAMEYNIPIQIFRDRIAKPSSEMQDEASIAWNFYTALYYKAGGIPWSLKKESSNITCFAGISFYRTRDKKTIQTSVAQIFNEHGNGVILRGTPVKEDKKDRQPHLTEVQAYNLLKESLSEYYNAIKIFPQRLVIHKSSNYSEEEIDGFKRVASDMNINSIDLVTIMPTNFRLYRDNDYPPLRGTMFSLDKCRHFLYTRGYVEYYGTYPGKYIPNPIEVRLFSFDESPEQICKEILSLTKMNWNNTQFDRKFPITIECSRNVGEILKYVPTDLKPQIKYSFYM